MTDQNFYDHQLDYDVIIIGAGLAGICLSISLAKNKFKVLVVDKGDFPRHKVCGEYISNESFDYLQNLGLDFSIINFAKINKLKIFAPDSNFIESELELGGFGISRYLLDDELRKIAENNGVEFLLNSNVDLVTYKDDLFEVKVDHKTFLSKLTFGCFGRRSSIDRQLKRSFLNEQKKNYLGVKYHVKIDFPIDEIHLYNFEDGYCGVSKVENDIYTICYLIDSKHLKKYQSIKVMEENILFKNIALKSIFSQCVHLYPEPLTISQINFKPKSIFDQHIVMCGDAAGTIPPLCGNGMSMAINGSKILSEQSIRYMNGELTRKEFEFIYEYYWNDLFLNRIRVGRLIQSLFGSVYLTNFTVKILKYMPKLVKKIVLLTHGSKF